MQPVSYFVFAILILLVSVMPKVSSQYWLFRICDFGRIQLLVLQIILLVISFFLPNYPSTELLIIQFLLSVVAIENIVLLAPFLPLKNSKLQIIPKGTKTISIISANVFQDNREYETFFSFIKDLEPDIFFTMESNADWEKALRQFDTSYPYHQKVALENTYGMHFYSKLKITSSTVNYFMADDVPSFYITLSTSNAEQFVFIGLHPPPPSPTEEPNSKERDGELIKVGELAKNCKHPVIVMGDFNNVSWSKSANLFKKISGLTDPRKGRGFFPTYHARYWLLRFPIDLCYHSNSVVMQEFKTLGKIGSDHLPMYCKFFIKKENTKPEKNSEPLDENEQEEAQEMVEEGINENGDRKK